MQTHDKSCICYLVAKLPPKSLGTCAKLQSGRRKVLRVVQKTEFVFLFRIQCRLVKGFRFDLDPRQENQQLKKYVL